MKHPTSPTPACADCRTLLGGYVLHALEPEEAEAVRRHLAACDACADEHTRLLGIPAVLDAAGPDGAPLEQPPAALEEAVLDRFARENAHGREAESETPRRRRAGALATLAAATKRRLSKPLPAALAGAVAAAAVTAAIAILPGGTDEARGESYWASLQGTTAAPAATAKANLRVLSSGTRVTLKVRDLKGTPDTVYELWCLRDDGGKVSAGTFRTDAQGNAEVSLTTAAVPGEYHRLGIERRLSNRPGEAVMAGEIQYPHS